MCPQLTNVTNVAEYCTQNDHGYGEKIVKDFSGIQVLNFVMFLESYKIIRT